MTRRAPAARRGATVPAAVAAFAVTVVLVSAAALTAGVPSGPAWADSDAPEPTPLAHTNWD